MHYACFERLPGKMHSIETDGRKITSNREPAGQKCVYITPGKSTLATDSNIRVVCQPVSLLKFYFWLVIFQLMLEV